VKCASGVTYVDNFNGIIDLSSELHNTSAYYQHIGLSGVRALPLAAGRNEGGHYFLYKNITAIFREYNRALLFLPTLFKTTEGVVVGFQNFAWDPT
jgi:hypothetical protein